jgi:hypothetical protein
MFEISGWLKAVLTADAVLSVTEVSADPLVGDEAGKPEMMAFTWSAPGIPLTTPLSSVVVELRLKLLDGVTGRLVVAVESLESDVVVGGL